MQRVWAFVRAVGAKSFLINIFELIIIKVKQIK